MEKERSPLRWIGVIAALAIASFYFIGPLGVDAVQNQTGVNGPAQARTDIVIIDSLKVYGDLERPKVQFFHEKHTQALEKKNKDCQTCHLSENNRLSIKYQRLKDTDKKSVMGIYHAGCIGCHTETAMLGEKSGPVSCGACHREDMSLVSARQPIGFDRSLHYRHSKAQDKKCERCHHAYDEKTKKLFYAKGKEGTCRYCHLAQTEENRIALREASHIACVDCHRKTRAKNLSAGPVNCSGCHDAKEQQLIEKVPSVPRMEMKQPDAVLLQADKSKPFSEPLKQPVEARMNPVPFNHKAHEGYNDTCRSCHHASMEACSQCHSPMGKKEGGFVNLQLAAHQQGAQSSCVGCHNKKTRVKTCTGCHGAMGKGKGQAQDTAACLKCHMDPSSINLSASLPADKTAAALLESRSPNAEMYADELIPEKVVIQAISKVYGPVELPHRKIVKTLVKKITGNKLAGYFHGEKGTVCQGCHHNSPAAVKPPRCTGCHGKPFDENNPFKPGLMAAYHNQCMQCHDDMGVEKPVSTNCTACHKKR